MVNTKHKIKRCYIDLLNPFDIIRLIEDNKLSDIDILNLYNQTEKEFNVIYLDINEKDFMHKYFDIAHNMFIDLMKDRIRQ